LTGIDAAADGMKEREMKDQQINVYARFIADEPRTETQRVATKPPRPTVRVTGAAVRSPKPGVKKRGGLPK
jgi:hypothetical protein